MFTGTRRSLRDFFVLWTILDKEIGTKDVEIRVFLSNLFKKNRKRMDHIELGKLGERLAEAYLKRHDIEVLETNYRWKREEIDLIAKDTNILVFVEVKTRTSDAYAPPEKSVSRSKQRHLIRAANAYIQEKKIDLEARFDVISVIYNTYETRIDHIRDAFYPAL